MSVKCTDFNSKVENGVCLFVPKIHPRFNFKSVKGVFIQCGFGFVERVNIFRKGYFKSAVVIFRAGSWNTRNPMANKVLQKLQAGESFRLTPEEDKSEEFPDEFWMVFVNSQDRNKSTKAPRPKIQFVPKSSKKVTRPMSPTYGPQDSDNESVPILSTPPSTVNYEREEDLDA